MIRVVEESPDRQAYFDLVAEARRQPPTVAIVLGSGLGDLESRLRPLISCAFRHIPDMPLATAAGHRGELMLGEWCGHRVLLFFGRLHRYEGYAWDEVCAPVRLARQLGARTLLLTNAVGGIRDGFEPGTLVAIEDHLEWTKPTCWNAPGPGSLGGERPSPYDAKIRLQLTEAAQRIGMHLPSGIYAQVTGPCYETPAEIRALRTCKADIVGMSTACEANHAASLGMRVAAISCVTNRAAGLSDKPICHEEVLEAGGALRKKLAALLENYLQRDGMD
ncbi:MAG: purine-nucleoside phosphorylase [Gemmataceae bacterium]